MSIISTVYVPEGIAMAADSRITGTNTNNINGSEETTSFTISDNGQKLVRLNKVKVGISFCGIMIKDGNTIADFLRLFEINEVEEKDTVETVANKLFKYMGDFSGTIYMVAGYYNDEAFIYQVAESVTRLNSTDNISIIFHGQQEAINKLLALEPTMKINLNLMPLKDGIDLAEFLIDLTIKYERFKDGIQTCGGPIDVLVITKDDIFWHKHKIYTKGE